MQVSEPEQVEVQLLRVAVGGVSGDEDAVRRPRDDEDDEEREEGSCRADGAEPLGGGGEDALVGGAVPGHPPLLPADVAQDQRVEDSHQRDRAPDQHARDEERVRVAVRAVPHARVMLHVEPMAAPAEEVRRLEAECDGPDDEAEDDVVAPVE